MLRCGLTARLLSCASVIALAGTAVGPASAHPHCTAITHPTTINTNKTCVTVTNHVYGDVTNNAKIGDSGGERAAFFIGGDGLITGKLVNNGKILGAPDGLGALTLGDDADVQGGIVNNGTIASYDGNGINLGYRQYGGEGGEGGEDSWGGEHGEHHWSVHEAALTGDIVNAGLIKGDDDGIAALYGTMSGTLINQATGKIVGGDHGVYIADSFTAWTGGIENYGLVEGDSAGIQIGDFGSSGGVVFSGGIFNYAGGEIISKSGPSIAIAGASFSGGIYNDGLITQYPGDGGEGGEYGWGGEGWSPYAGVGIVIATPTFEGGIFNDTNGEIYGVKGPAIWITDKTQSFDGGIANLGLIKGADDAIRIESATFAGGLSNGAWGSIVATEGDAIFASAAWTGDFENHGLISGAHNGFTYEGSTFVGDVKNAGAIWGGHIGVAMSGDTLDGAFINTGDIAGGATGVALNFTKVAGGFTNSGSIVGGYGDGVAIDVATWGADGAPADIVNTTDGVISGAETGFRLDVGTMYGNFINDGAIHGGGPNTGLHITADEFFGDIVNNGAVDAPSTAANLEIGLLDGAFANTGDITGGVTGAALTIGQMTGNFTNDGAITGETGKGADIVVTSWGTVEAPVDILNTENGVITGGDVGFALDVVTLHGDITNDGAIDGGSIGLRVSGNTFDGAFTNTGDIDGGATGASFYLTQITGNFTNDGSIAGEYGKGVDIVVTSWGEEDARVEILNTENGVITGGAVGFALDAATLHGDITNDGAIDGGNTGLLASGNTYDGAFTNTGDIGGGATGVALSFTQVTGGFTNTGSITGETGDGVGIDVGIWGAEGAPADIVNTTDGAITGGETGFRLEVGTMYGNFLNDGEISGGGQNTGLHITADEVLGDIGNNGAIDSPFDAVNLEIGLLDGSIANTGDITGGVTGAAMTLGEMTGDFTNDGSITGETGNGVDIVVTSWGAVEAPVDILNTEDGVITGGDVGFALSLVTLHGDFTNDGAIDGGNIGVLIDGETYENTLVAGGTFDGSFTNTGDIGGGATGAALNLAQVTGAFTNSGSITGDSGDGVAIDVGTWGAEGTPADIVNTIGGVITGGETGFRLNVGTMYGDFLNDGEIAGAGPETGLHVTADEFFGDITNNGGIDAPSDAVNLEIGLLDGAFANTGRIAGGVTGAAMTLDEMTGNFTNSGSISGETGNGVDIVVTSWGAVEAPVDVLNTEDGVITGGDIGFALSLVTLHGDITNDGAIDGGNIGLLINGASIENTLVAGGGTFDGAFTNTGNIGGGATGVSISLAEVTGGFTNSGAITGETGAGVAISVDTWGAEGAPADIVNTETGAITGGETGFLLDVGTMYGDFINDGEISGGGQNTGLHIVADEFFGNIANSGALDAPSNALHLVIGTLDGDVENTGTVTAGEPAGVAVELAIGNGTTFTNTGGGLILGDVDFGGNASYAFVGEDGGVEGDLIGHGGEGNDDTVTVQNGTQYFVAHGGSGTAGNFASFAVEDGGVAIMGARFEGDPDHLGYAFSNVDALHVSNGGLLYIDKATTLNVDNSYVQEAGSTLEFYLGAPGGEGFSDLTGTVVAGADDYGQILVDGTATLDGAVVGFLDPAFASANAGLDQVQYNDVLVATGGISGDFSTVALIADSSLFELTDTIEGNTLDLQVTRTSLNDIGGLSGIIVNTGGPFDSMVNDRSNGIGSGSCGLAGPGWCFNKFAANDPGATQVMTDATEDDPFQWLRTGVRREGETSVWGRAVGVWGRTDGDIAPGSNIKVGGAIAGIDHVFTPIFMAGLAAQWTATDVDFRGRPDNADVDSFELGAYASYGDTRLYLNANASVIFHDIEVNRFTPTGHAVGDYDGTSYSAFAEAGKIFETEEGLRIQPFVALSYSHLDTNAYSETGSGTLLDVSASDFDSLKSMVGARLGYPIQMDSGRKVVPEVRLAWAHEFMDDQASHYATIQGQPPAPSLILGEEFSRDTLIVGAGVTVPLSASSSLFVDYDAGLNRDITTHTVSAGFRITW